MRRMLHVAVAVAAALILSGCFGPRAAIVRTERIPCPDAVPVLEGIQCAETCDGCSSGTAAHEWGSNCAAAYHDVIRRIRTCIDVVE